MANNHKKNQTMPKRKIPDKPIKEIEILEESATSLYSETENKVYVVSTKRGDSLAIELTKEPVIENGFMSCEGDIIKDLSDDLSGAFLGDLLPYLTVRIQDKTTHLAFQGLEVIVDASQLEKKTKNESYFGVFKTFSELTEQNAVIAFQSTDTKLVLLSIGKEMRRVIICDDVERAARVLALLKAFPPFKENKFYAKAQPFAISELEEENLKDESFVYFEEWQSLLLNFGS